MDDNNYDSGGGYTLYKHSTLVVQYLGDFAMSMYVRYTFNYYHFSYIIIMGHRVYVVEKE